MIPQIVHTLDFCLQKELKNCRSVLDLGCGPSSPLKFCKKIKYSIGVEIFKKYINLSKKQKIHNKYIQKDIINLNFSKNSFDAVILIEVLEHLSKKNGNKIIELANKWAKKKIIVTTPNNFFPMNKVDNNRYQKHLSGWSVNELNEKGFKCHGLAGIKFFYNNKNTVESLMKSKKYQNIRFRPKIFFYYLNGLLQIITYFFPKISFGLFAVIKK